MTILNLQIEVDWLDEEMTLDDSVRESVMRRIEEKATAKVLSLVEKEVSQKVMDTVDGLISKQVENEIQKFLTEPRNITDKYGDIVRKNVTVSLLIKEKIDHLMEVKTHDEDGRTNGYGSKLFTKFEYFIHNDAAKTINQKTEQMTKAVEKQIETLVSDKIKAHVADGLTNMIMDNSTALSLKPNKKESK